MAIKTAFTRVFTCMQSFLIIVLYPSSSHDVLKRAPNQVTVSDCLTKCGLIYGRIDLGGWIFVRTRLRSCENLVIQGDFVKIWWLVRIGAATSGMSDVTGCLDT